MQIEKTSDAATEKALRELFSMDPEDKLEDVIPVCSGEWKKAPDDDIWWFWKYVTGDEE